MDLAYSIGALARVTGISQHTIRAWERRHNALSPSRSATNRRVYRQEDVERLALLKRGVEAGHSIGLISRLTTEQLQNLEGSRQSDESVTRIDAKVGTSEALLRSCQSAIDRLDAEELEASLERGSAAVGVLGLLDGVVIPLLAEIEARWMQGSLRISQEHLASTVLRNYLDRSRRLMNGSYNAPRLLVTTPRNQQHELGALMAGIVAAAQSWNVTYLGANLPALEIGEASRLSSASAIGLSLVYPTDDLEMPMELGLLRQSVGPELPILAGGRAAHHYARALNDVGAQICRDLPSLHAALDRIRGNSGSANKSGQGAQ